MTDIMLDIETLGLNPGAIVLSVGAVAFDLTDGSITREFYSVIDPEDSETYGLVAEPATVKWWFEQEQAATGAFSGATELLPGVARAFARWYDETTGAPARLARLWSQGPMDPAVWGHAMEAAGVTRPWNFRDTRDTRTAYDLAGFDRHSVPRSGLEHHALDDAKHQVKCLHLALGDLDTPV